MKNLWTEADAARACSELELRVYSSRLLGAEQSLVLHGGGNTSVKITERNLLGETEDILYVKGSGWDLASITAEGFSPLRLERAKKMAGLQEMSDAQMVAELAASMTRPSAPSPSVEAILHAIVPWKYVDHTHADAVVTITNSVHGPDRIREIYGATVVVVPYVMPGFDLAKLCADVLPRELQAETLGMVLLNHGIFTFGETARVSYDRMIDLVTRAEDYLRRKNAWNVDGSISAKALPEGDMVLPNLRRKISGVAGGSVILRRQADDKALAFAQRADLGIVAAQGPATPDHVIRTKPTPLIGRGVADYAAAYREYFSRHERGSPQRKKPLDPAPRVVLDPELGMCTVGRSAAEAAITADIFSHTMEIIARATALGGYQALPAKDLFAVEYWDLEQAKLLRGAKPRMFAGEIAFVTGAASGIGRACVDSFLSRGAAVTGVDLNPCVEKMRDEPAFIGVRCDVTSEGEIVGALNQTIERFGGLDMLVLNAGIFPASRRISELAAEDWRGVMRVNFDANLTLLRLAHPLLKLALNGGRVVVVGSKNVSAPGVGAAAYSASKAALNQLARVAALEWGGDGIRVNSVHPHGVFDTGVWTNDVIHSRASSHGMTVEEYRTNNILRTSVTSFDVAELVAELCGPLFSKSTGAQIPIDGGSDRII